VAALVTRLPFVLDNPDWGPVLIPEHCFFLSAPVIHENRQALSPGEAVPFWIVNPEQILQSFHAGIGLMHGLVRAVYEISSIRTVAALKIIGLALLSLYLAVLVWALNAIWPREPLRIAVPVFLSTVPPTLFLWETMFPLGHYTETYLVYGLLLPYVVAVARRRVSVVQRLSAGALVGAAMAYTFSNAVFLVAFVLFRAAAGSDTSKGRALQLPVDLLAFLVPSALTFALLGRLSSLSYRLTSSMYGGTDGPYSVYVTAPENANPGSWMIWATYLGDLIEVGVGGRLAGSPLLFRGGTALLAVVVIAGALAMLSTARRVYWPPARSPSAQTNASDRFLSLNGLLLLGFCGAFHLFESGAFKPIYYLEPVFPMLFVGAGTLFAAGVAHRRVIVRLPAILVLVTCGICLLLGWRDNYLFNARLRQVPDQEGCDSLCLDGYFWDETPDAEPWRPPALRTAAWHPVAFDRVGGTRRCARSLPGNDHACALHGFVGENWYRGNLSCAGLTAEDARTCAQAIGATHPVCDPGSVTLAKPPESCASFEGELLDACITGAFQGSTYGVSFDDCMRTLSQLCTETFPEPAARAACFEQTAALTYAVSSFPEPSPQPPARCSSWPAPWLGLCERALAATDAPCSTGDPQCCEEIYARRFSEELPDHGRIPYDECLMALGGGYYPWCAIGVARQLGEVECSWSGASVSEAAP